MSADSSQINRAAIRSAASDLRLPADVEERIQPRPAELSAATTQPPTRASDPAVADGVAPALLVALLQEYAMHQAPIVEIQRKRREFRIPGLVLGVGGGVAFVVCAVLKVLEFAASRTLHSDSPWGPCMFVSGFLALIMGFAWWMMYLEGRQKIDTGEKGKADVMRRLLAAFPQLQGADAEALLRGKAAQAIMARPAN